MDLRGLCTCCFTVKSGPSLSAVNVHRKRPHQDVEKRGLGVVSSEASGSRSGHKVDIRGAFEALQPHGDRPHRRD